MSLSATVVGVVAGETSNLHCSCDWMKRLFAMQKFGKVDAFPTKKGRFFSA